MTEAGIMGFLNKTGETLKILDLVKTGVSFAEAGSLNCSLPALEELNIRRCANVTEARIKAFLDKTGAKSVKVKKSSFKKQKTSDSD